MVDFFLKKSTAFIYDFGAPSCSSTLKEDNCGSRVVSFFNPRVEFSILRMEGQKNDLPQTAPVVKPAMTSCRKKKSEDATFLQDLRDHIDEFIHASMDEHKACFKKSVQKLFGMSKVAVESSSGANEGESSLPLQTTVSR